MSATEIIVLAIAGFAAGTINAVVGSGTLITFPTLLAFGFAPVSATMSNGVGLVAGGVSGTWGYRRELRGQWHRLRWQIPASVAGGLLGALLLMWLPASSFKSIVPVLLVLALVLVVTGPRIQRWAARKAEAAGQRHDEMSQRQMVWLIVATFGVGIYGGYFTAAQGIMMMGVLGALVPEPIQRSNAVKNLLTLIANVISALAYIAFSPDEINWTAAGLIAAGSLIGGSVGARYGRLLPPNVLRACIVVLGIIGIWRVLA